MIIVQVLKKIYINIKIIVIFVKRDMHSYIILINVDLKKN